MHTSESFQPQPNPLELELKQAKTRDPHIAYMQTVSGVLKHPSRPGLSVLHLKGLVERVFTSGELFEPGNPEVRLDFQPIILTLSDSMRKVGGFDVVALFDRFYSLQGLADQLGTTPQDVQKQITGKTFNELNPQLQTIITLSSNPSYESGVVQNVINPQVLQMEGQIDKPEQTVLLADIDITTISTRYPDRELTDVETEYLYTLVKVASTKQHSIDGEYPIGLSETYLTQLWNRITGLHPDYLPRVDFSPVAAALSPVFEQTTGKSLRPVMQLYEATRVGKIIGNMPRTATILDAPDVVSDLLSNYDNLQTEKAIDDVVKSLR